MSDALLMDRPTYEQRKNEFQIEIGNRVNKLKELESQIVVTKIELNRFEGALVLLNEILTYEKAGGGRLEDLRKD